MFNIKPNVFLVGHALGIPLIPPLFSDKSYHQNISGAQELSDLAMW